METVTLNLSLAIPLQYSLPEEVKLNEMEDKQSTEFM